MIEVRGIKKAFGDQEVLKGIDMDLKPGQCNLIIGSSGSGKTVMLKSIVGLIQPDAGQVLLVGKIGLESDGLFVVVTDALVAL